MASAIFQSSTFGFAGVFPPKYTSIVLSGQVCWRLFSPTPLTFDPITGQCWYICSTCSDHIPGHIPISPQGQCVWLLCCGPACGARLSPLILCLATTGNSAWLILIRGQWTGRTAMYHRVCMCVMYRGLSSSTCTRPASRVSKPSRSQVSHCMPSLMFRGNDVCVCAVVQASVNVKTVDTSVPYLKIFGKVCVFVCVCMCPYPLLLLSDLAVCSQCVPCVCCDSLSLPWSTGGGGVSECWLWQSLDWWVRGQRSEEVGRE